MSATTNQSFTCPFCNLFCQDVQIPNLGSSKPVWQPGCTLAQTSLEQLPAGNPLPCHDGASMTWNEALDLAHRWLHSPRIPLVVLSGDASCEAQRVGVELAQRLHATVDTPLSRFDLAVPMASIDPGYLTCTMGEVAQKADKLLFWGCWPRESHPRLFERLGWQDKNNTFEIHIGGRTSSPNELWLKQGETVAFIERARLLARGETLLDSTPELASLVEFLGTAHLGVLFYGEEMLVEGRHPLTELFRLLDDVKGQGHWQAVNLPVGGNILGAAEALSRATGFAQAVRFTEAGAEFVLQSGGTEGILSREASDLVIFVGQPAGFSSESIKHLKEIPSITLSPTEPVYRTLWLPVSQLGIHVEGTVLRLDGVTIPLSTVWTSELSSMEDMLGQLAEGVGS
jgi:formylmethanofuran dehydrogenase subunit B